MRQFKIASDYFSKLERGICLHLEPWQWIFGATAALLVGISKTGIPGIGILVVPMLAQAFGSRPSIGIMLPMLIMGDIFAVAWYRKHAQWDKLVKLLPWVIAGVAIGAIALWQFARLNTNRDILDIVIGSLILIMLSLHFAQKYLSDQLTPKSQLELHPQEYQLALQQPCRTQPDQLCRFI